MRAVDVIVAVLVGANAIIGLVGYRFRKLSRGRRDLTHEEYQERLRKENESLDRQLEEMKRK